MIRTFRAVALRPYLVFSPSPIYSDLPHTGTISTLKRAQRADSNDYAQPALIGGNEPEQ